MSGRRLVPANVVNSFADLFSGTTLREIDAMFMDAGIDFDAAAEDAAGAEGNGQRVSRVSGYVATIDFTNRRAAATFLELVADRLASWESADGGGTPWLDRLRTNLRKAGYSWDGERITSSPTMATEPYATRLNTVEDLAIEVERIYESVERDPADAITAARALVEAACKTVLDELGEDIDHKADLPALYRATATALKIDATQHDVVYRQILQGLVSSVQGLAEIRNRLSDSHAPGPRAARPKPRHARMAAGAAMVVATFLVDTLEERRTGMAPAHEPTPD